DNTFDVSRWTGLATLAGAAGIDRVVSATDADFTLTDTSLVRSTGGAFTLSAIERATLTGGLGDNVLDASAFTGSVHLARGPGDDIVDGGPGDDIISGDAGRDLLLGGAGNDVIYGHSVGAAGDDLAVDYLYGDFGTNGNEPGSGRDQLFGQGGNDFLYGEGE